MARHRASKSDIVLREYAPQRFGYKNIEVVHCFYCGIEQRRTNINRANGTTQSVRLVHGHHIFPLTPFPEMAHEPENYVFLCNDHHTEFHKTYDSNERYPNLKYNPNIKIKGNNQPFHIRHIPAGINELQEYLGLTAKETIAYQLGWNEYERFEAGVQDGYLKDKEMGESHYEYA